MNTINSHAHQQERSSYTQVDFLLEGVTCASCVSKIERVIQAIKGVDKVAMNFAERTVSVQGLFSSKQVMNTLKRSGYSASIIDLDTNTASEQKIRSKKYYVNALIRKTGVALLAAIPLMLYGFLFNGLFSGTPQAQYSWFTIGILTALVMTYSGKHFFMGALQSIRSRQANMDTLITMGTATAWLYSMVVVLYPAIIPVPARHLYFETSVMIIGLVNLGLVLEIKVRGRTSTAIHRMMDLTPKIARVLDENLTNETDRSIDAILIGDHLRVRPGEIIPVDGIIFQGNACINESMITGEAMPVKKQPSDKVSAGTLNTSGSFILKVTRVGKETTVARIIEKVTQAQTSKLPIGHLVDRVAAVFVPTVITIAIVSALLWLFFGPQPRIAYALVTFTSVLIIACPCALGLATPISAMAGIGKAAESGILICNGEALQNMNNISTVVLDKTGTITDGFPTVTEIIPLTALTETRLYYLAASLENSSEHPLAGAIVRSAKSVGIVPDNAETFTTVTGRGVSGRVKQHQLLLGNQAFMDANSIDTNPGIAIANSSAKRGNTPVYFAIDNKLAAIISIKDAIKSDSFNAIKRLQDRGIHVVMLSGDNQATVKAVAEAVNITDYYAELLPEQKSDIILKLQEQNQVVGMVGDGINDAPALALANVGFAIGTGSDIAIDSADITLIRGSLHGVADAIAISKATLHNIKQNLLGALLYNSAGIALAAGLFYALTGILLSPVIAAAAMALSSVTVVSNARRLRFPGRKIR